MKKVLKVIARIRVGDPGSFVIIMSLRRVIGKTAIFDSWSIHSLHARS